MENKITKIYEDYGQLHEEGCELNDEGGSFDGCTCAVKSMVQEIITALKEECEKRLVKGEDSNGDIAHANNQILHSLLSYLEDIK